MTDDLATTTDTDAAPHTWELSPAEFAATAEKIAKINARAVKRGFTGRVTLTGTEREVITTNGLTGDEVTVVVVDTVITGEAPSYAGWTFLAAVDTVTQADGEAGYILRYAPGVAASQVDRADLAVGRCQHCNRDSGNRIYTYLVRHDDGRVRQVGSTCIQDFLGWTGRPVFIFEDDIREELDDLVSGGGHRDPLPMVPAEILAAAFAAVKVWGWTAAGSWDGIPTAGRVQDFFHDNRKPGKEAREAMGPFMEEGRRQAAEVVKALTEGLEGKPGYEENLLVAIGAAYVAPRQVPLVASAISCYDRMMGQRARYAARPDRSQVVHLGTPGAKVEVTGVVTTFRECEGYQPGTVQFRVVIENATTVAMTWTTAAWAFAEDAPAVGDTVTITGTVKKHDTFRDTPQTILTRTKATVVARAALAAAA